MHGDEAVHVSPDYGGLLSVDKRSVVVGLNSDVFDSCRRGHSTVKVMVLKVKLLT